MTKEKNLKRKQIGIVKLAKKHSVPKMPTKIILFPRNI